MSGGVRRNQAKEKAHRYILVTVNLAYSQRFLTGKSLGLTPESPGKAVRGIALPSQAKTSFLEGEI